METWNNPFQSPTHSCFTSSCQYKDDRADIAYVVGVVSQFMQKPRTIHNDVAYRILWYLKGSPGKGLLFPSSGSLQMTGDSDADWAGDALDRESITGKKYWIVIGVYIVEEQEVTAWKWFIKEGRNKVLSLSIGRCPLQLGIPASNSCRRLMKHKTIETVRNRPKNGALDPVARRGN